MSMQIPLHRVRLVVGEFIHVDSVTEVSLLIVRGVRGSKSHLGGSVGCDNKEDKGDILAEELRKIRRRKKYLIVLDAMWDCMAWNDLSLSCPNDRNGSKIVVTTQLEKVAKYVRLHIDPYFLQFLTPDESLKLLEGKVFQQEGFLPELQDPCLLYMGMYPEDVRIPVSKLISLWIEQGFVQNIESGILIEEAAEGYLTELISSNLAIVSEREYNGKVKYFQVHDLVLHFCLEKSREANFMLAVKGPDSQFQPLDWKGILSGLHFPSSLKKLVPKESYIESAISFIAGLPSLEYLHLWNLRFNQSKWCLGDITFHKLKILKVSYLAISKWVASDESFPQLETLVITVCCKLKEIPLSFADIPTLKHIQLIKCWNKSLETSALKIMEEVKAIEGCDRIDLTIRVK
ncbi:hypothetical protein RDI58_015086 [Solanum bulbocastanum]|uniref:Uncharacterized protein n=1 Tax=Solanum bulbocastanum TaxID=147425 RepID=A0AAN8TMM2_SOLBU